MILCVFVTIDAMVNFHGDADVDANIDVRYEQSIIYHVQRRNVSRCYDVIIACNSRDLKSKPLVW